MHSFGNKPTTIYRYISDYHYNAMFSNTMQLILLFCFFSLLHGVAHADPPYNLCPNTTNIAHDSPFQSNLNNLLDSISSNASVQNYYNTSIGYDPNGVYGLFLCYGFVSGDKCENCIATASQDIQRLCANTSDAVVWEEVCQLRYSNQRFFGELDVTGNIPRKNWKNVSEPDRFRSVLNDTLYNLTKLAAFDPSTGMYVTGAVNFTGTDTIYALVQCTTELSRDDCNTCLETAITNISSCCSFARGARLLSRSCYLRYEFYAFYEGTTEFANSTPIQSTVSSNGWEKWKTVVLAIGSAIFVVALLGLCIYCFTKRNGTKKSKVKRKNFGQEIELCDPGHHHNTDLWHQNLQGREEFPFIDLATINVATDGFSDSNKLGQGGFGPVYKGILPGGKEVAVKRLSSSSEQGSDEFINEVLLILKLQHKNLVRLLGFCLDGEEMLLIYEYMPNSSLDVFLFDPSKRAQLNWSRRLNIINGIARGILYLHEDSRLRIIHRDLKASNILLDSEMNPKISDFGMARIFAGTDGEANTAMIVGTYGYMAPEYAMEGLYSVKSDVFSFGVLLLEIITGRRNAGFHLSNRGPSLLAYAWQLWNEERGLELMDPLLMDSCCPDEFLRCMHIGLLCVQEDPYERPTMSYVVVMLKSETVILSPPERPAFSVGRFADHYEAIDNICSVNLLTLSNITPR